MGGRIEVAVIEGAPGFAMREELTARLGPATAATHRLDVTLALEETGVALTQQDVTTRYNVTGHRRLRAGAARRRTAGHRRHGAGADRLQHPRRSAPRPMRASPPSTTPSGGWRSISPTASCSGSRSRPGTGLTARSVAGPPGRLRRDPLHRHFTRDSRLTARRPLCATVRRAGHRPCAGRLGGADAATLRRTFPGHGRPMKLTGRDAARFLAKPDRRGGGRPALRRRPDAGGPGARRAGRGADGPGRRGGDAARAHRRRTSGAEPARAVDDATRRPASAGRGGAGRGGRRRRGAGARAALADWRAGDATLVGRRRRPQPANALRKAFEAARSAVAIGVYDDPPGGATRSRRRSPAPGSAGSTARASPRSRRWRRRSDPGDFAQLVAKLGLYKRGDRRRSPHADVEACAPAAAAGRASTPWSGSPPDGETGRLAAAIRQLGGSPTTLTIAAGRHFRTLYARGAGGRGVEAGLARARPPVFGPRAGADGGAGAGLRGERLEQALALVVDAELMLRSSRPVPAAAAPSGCWCGWRCCAGRDLQRGTRPVGVDLGFATASPAFAVLGARTTKTSMASRFGELSSSFYREALRGLCRIGNGRCECEAHVPERCDPRSA